MYFYIVRFRQFIIDAIKNTKNIQNKLCCQYARSSLLLIGVEGFCSLFTLKTHGLSVRNK